MFCIFSAPSPADRFAQILDALCRAVAAGAARNRAAAPLLVLLWHRLRRVMARFAALAAGVQTGRRPRPCAPAASRKPRSRRPTMNLPSGWSWLRRLVPEAGAYGSQLRYLMSQPDMAALLEVAPQAARILRPLGRLLIPPDEAPLLPPAKPAPLKPTDQPAPGGSDGTAPPDPIWKRA